MSCSARPWYFICKVNSTNSILYFKNTLCTLCLRGWKFHAMPLFICKIFARCLDYGALLGLSIVSWTLGEVLLFKYFVGMRGRSGDLVQSGGMWGLPWGLLCETTVVVGRNYVWCLAIVVILMGFGQAGAKRCGECLKVINWGWQVTEGGLFP